LCEQEGLQTLFEGSNGRCGDDVSMQIFNKVSVLVNY